MSTRLDTLVVGAGISGLAFAHARRAAAPGERLLVLEASARPGGLVRTSTVDGFRFEEGPEALPGNARETRELCGELGLELCEAPREAGKRYLQLDGKLREVPGGLGDLATSHVLSFGAKLRLMAEATRAREEALDGSIADFVRHRFGEEVLARVVDPLVAGIHAGDAETLSLRACFPEVARMVEEHGSVMAAMKARARAKKSGAQGGVLSARLFRPAEGMQQLTATLARALGAELRTGTPVQALERVPPGWRVREESGAIHEAARVVLALPLASARELVGTVAPDAAAALASMTSESLVSVVHAYRRSDVGHALDGFGYLVPKTAGGLVLGTLFSSTLDPAAAPEGHVLLRSLLGGARRPDAVALDDETLLAAVARECAAPLGLARGPVFARVGRHRGVIPRFDLEHVARRARLAEALPEGLAVLGNFTRGLGVESLVSAARALARAPVASAG